MNGPMLIHIFCGCEKTDPPGLESPTTSKGLSQLSLLGRCVRKLYHVIAMDPNTFSKDTLPPKYAPEKS
jgi:hypothetical protein